MTTTTTTTHTADAALIDLGNRLVAGMFAELDIIAALDASGEIDDDAKLSAACEPLNAVIDEIRRNPATTMQGFTVHRLALEWVDGTLATDLPNFLVR